MSAAPRSGGSHGGGGWHGGGGNHGGGGWHGGGGHGGGGWHGGGSWHGGHGWHGGWGWRGGWYWPYWGWGWGWGWGYPGWYGYYGYPYYGAGYYGGYGAPYGSVGYMPGAWGAVDTDVSPEEARVTLDGRYIGTADDFDGYPDYLYLKPGKYKVDLALDGFETRTVDLDVRAGQKIELKEKLGKIPGASHYGSYDTPTPEGGVQRFWGHDKNNALVSVNVEAGDPGPGDVRVDTDQYSDWRDRGSGRQAPPPPRDDQEPPDNGNEGGSGRYAPPPPTNNAPAPSSSRGRLVFHVAPADAAIYVDDHFAGTAEELSSLSRGLQIRPGSHKIVVSRPGFDSQSIQVDLEAGASEVVQIDLAQHP